MDYDMLAEPLSTVYTTSLTASTAVDMSGEELFRFLGTRRKVAAEGAREHLADDGTTYYAYGEEEYVFVRNAEAATAFSPGESIIVHGTTAYGGYNCIRSTGIINRQRVRGVVVNHGDSTYTIPAGSAGWIKCRGVVEQDDDGTVTIGQPVSTTGAGNPERVADTLGTPEMAIGLALNTPAGAGNPAFVLLDL